jgi:hypothetical protein
MIARSTQSTSSTPRASLSKLLQAPWLALALLLATLAPVSAAFAQTGGQGAVEGTVTDPSGAVVPNASVSATNQASGVVTTRPSSSGGLFSINPLIPGTYTVSVTAAGFQGYTQQNLVVDALKVTGLNITLAVGRADQTVTVSEAPPRLDTTNATLGGVIENATYQNLPLQMNGQQRDPTAFATLLPGAQSGARAPIIGGTGNYIAEIYVDGIPTTTANQQGDNRVVSNSIPVEAVDQFQVLTSVPGAEYQGAGALNFTIKSGGNAYHGTAAAFVRNTIFDTWGFSAPALTQKDVNGNTIPAKKPIEHQNELVAAVGGPIPFTRKKGFFFVTYDKYHGRNGINPNTLTVPTALMRTGDFTELGSAPLIFDPTSNTCVGTSCTRKPVMGMKNGIATANVIPASQLSPITQYMQKYLPAPSNTGTVNNYLGGVPSGYDNWEFLSKVDYDLTPAQRLSVVLTLGSRRNVPFTVGGTPAGVVLPLPYAAGGLAVIKPTIIDVEHSIVITPRLVNQFKFGFVRFSQPIGSLTENVSGYRAAADIGITNLPAGQASNEFPGVTFGASKLFPNVQNTWTSAGASGATQTTVPNAFTLVDNLQLTKGRHSMTAGIQIQWLEDNVAPQSGPSGIYTQTYSANDTANFIRTSAGVYGNTIDSTAGGYSYASFLLGAVNTSGTTIQAFSETGGRFRPISPYFQDDWKITPKLTANLGLRYDYFPPYHEVQDRWSFLNATAVNPVTGNLGALQFAGNRGADISCQCRTPVHTWDKNIGPRIGLAYSVNDKTVIRSGYALVFSRAGGVGGRAGAGTGTSQAGFTANLVLPSAQTTGAASGPSYYLNNSAAFQAAGLANTSFGGPGFVLPTPATPNAAALAIGTGNYINSAGAFQSPSGAPGYADPYLSGRAPEVSFYNFGIQRALTNDLTLMVNYSGSQAHFLSTGANARGYWAGQLDPKYLAGLGGVVSADAVPIPILNAAATPANVAKAAAAMPGIAVPYAAYSAAASNKTGASVATISRMLTAFPQYSGTTDTWGNVGNVSYNSLQITLDQREWKGLTYTFNYTYSKNLGDDNTFRTGFDTPSGATSNGASYKQGRADRGFTTVAVPQAIAAYGVYKLPFGKGHMGNDSFLVRTIAGGWQFSSIFTYTSGAPLAITYAGCTAPLQGQCMPDLNPNFSGSARKNGSWGKGITAANFSAIPYIDVNAFSAPNNFVSTSTTKINQIGDAPRTAPLGLVSPSKYNVDASIRRTFDITPERLKFIFEVDCLNVSNKVTFGGISQAWAPGSSTFGTVGSASGNRDFQFAGRLNF